MARETTQVLLKRATNAQANKDLWRSLLSDAYEYFLPQRNPYWSGGDGSTRDHTPGQRKVDRVFSSTAQSSMISFANSIQSKMMPAFQKWVTLKAGPLVPENMKEAINRKLEEVTNQLFAVMQASNFDTSINEVLLDLGIGTGAMLILEGTINAPVRYVAVPLGQITLEEGPWGSVSGVFRTHEMKIRNIEKQWPDVSLSDDLRTKAADPEKSDEDVTLIEATYSEVDDSGAETWYYDVIDKKSEKRIVKREYNSNPWVTPRWVKVAGEVYGRGPAIQALPDVKTENKLVELVLKNAALHISGVYTGVDDGILNPNTVTIRPGVVIPVAANGGSRGASLVPLERTGSFDIAQIELERLTMSIKTLMFDRRLPAEGGSVRSATEIVERVRELAQDIGSPFGRLMRELIVPLVQRTLDLMTKQNLVPEIKVNGLTVQAVVVSPLAQEQNLNEVEAVVRWLDILNGTGGQQLLMLGAVIEDIPDWIGERLGVPSALRRDRESRNQLQQMAGQAAANGQQIPIQGADQAPAIGQAQPLAA